MFTNFKRKRIKHARPHTHTHTHTHTAVYKSQKEKTKTHTHAHIRACTWHTHTKMRYKQVRASSNEDKPDHLIPCHDPNKQEKIWTVTQGQSMQLNPKVTGVKKRWKEQWIDWGVWIAHLVVCWAHYPVLQRQKFKPPWRHALRELSPYR